MVPIVELHITVDLFLFNLGILETSVKNSTYDKYVSLISMQLLSSFGLEMFSPPSSKCLLRSYVWVECLLRSYVWVERLLRSYGCVAQLLYGIILTYATLPFFTKLRTTTELLLNGRYSPDVRTNHRLIVDERGKTE